jgi:hypothetical protein
VISLLTSMSTAPKCFFGAPDLDNLVDNVPVRIFVDEHQRADAIR